MTKNPLVQGINAAFVGVSETQANIDFYCGQLGYEVSESGTIPADQAAGLWGAGVDTEVTVLTAAGAPHGRIVLLSVADAAPAEYPHSADFGLAAIDMYTRDIEESHRVLTAAGHAWVTPPATWEVPLGEKLVTVTEGFCLAPDGTDVVFVEPAAPRGTQAWDNDPDRHYTELTSVVCHVPDFEAEVAFWGPDGLGLAVWYDVSFSSEGLEKMAELPPGSTMRLAFLAGAQTARIEVTQIVDRTIGTDRRDRQRTARSLGHSGWLVQTADLDAALARVTELGGTVLTGPAAGPAVLFGGSRVAVIDTPNRIQITLQETAQ